MKRNRFFPLLLLASGSAFAFPSMSAPSPEAPQSQPESAPASVPASQPESAPASAPVSLPANPSPEALKNLPKPPKGVVDVYVVGATGERKFLPGIEVIAVIFPAGSQGGGEPEERLSQTTDENGLARFFFQKPDPDKVVRVFARYNSVLFEGTPFALQKDTGSAVPIEVYSRSTDAKNIRLGEDSYIAIFMEEGVLSVEQMISFENQGDTTYVTKNGKLVIPLLPGAFGIRAAQNPNVAAEVEGESQNKLSLDLVSKPLLPGRTDMLIRYHLTAPEEADFSLELPLPFPAKGFLVAVHNEPPLESLTVQGFPPAKEVTPPGGGHQKFLIAQGLPASQSLFIEFKGSPYGKPVLIPAALGLAALIVVVGLWLAITLPKGAAPEAKKTSKAAMKEEKEKLFQELVGLERGRIQGKITEERYKKRREETMRKLIALSRRIS